MNELYYLKIPIGYIDPGTIEGLSSSIAEIRELWTWRVSVLPEIDPITKRWSYSRLLLRPSSTLTKWFQQNKVFQYRRQRVVNKYRPAVEKVEPKTESVSRASMGPEESFRVVFTVFREPPGSRAERQSAGRGEEHRFEME